MNIPNHVGIIMDGNGRWAEERNLSRSKGHLAGAKNFRKLTEYIFSLGIKNLSVFAFSTENFKREKSEVDYLMKLFSEFFIKEFKFVEKENIKVVFSGREENLPKTVLNMIDELQTKTKDNDGFVLNICLNYGSQFEVLDMVKKIVKSGVKYEDITLDLVKDNLYQNLGDLDFVIRTSGELRMSNFMLFQSAYAEYYFPKTYFPDFDNKEFDKALEHYNKRKRRFGGN